MNKERLLYAADWLEANVKQEMFDISTFRRGQYQTPECDSVGCVIGHTTALDRKNVLKNYTYDDGNIKFVDWSHRYFGLNLDEWFWCFAASWQYTDNTVKGAAARMRYIANNGLPKNWEDIMYGREPINYLILFTE